MESVPSRRIRWFVGGFLGLVLGSGLLGVEAWPLTGWKMYATLRHGEFWGWQVRAIAVDGTEQSVDLRRAPAAYHGVTHLLDGFQRRSDEKRQTVCLALAEYARTQHTDVARLAIDRVLRPRTTDPAAPLRPDIERVRVHECESPR